jgi:hypothetical protein
MSDHLSKHEIAKDAVQGVVEATATTVGEVATILTGAVKDVARSIGGLATEVFEIRDAARRAEAEHGRPDLHAVPDPVAVAADEATDGAADVPELDQA